MAANPGFHWVRAGVILTALGAFGTLAMVTEVRQWLGLMGRPSSVVDQPSEGAGSRQPVTAVATGPQPHTQVSTGPADPIPSAVPIEPVKTRSLTPTNPTSDTSGLGYTLVLEQCYRAGESIRCWGLMTNTTDAAERPRLWEATAFDDEGNSVNVPYGGLSFSNGADEQRILPSVPTKVFIRIDDPHVSAKTLALDLHLQWQDEGARNEHLVFKGIPVQ
jgi:hypothetical protein